MVRSLLPLDNLHQLRSLSLIHTTVRDLRGAPNDRLTFVSLLRSTVGSLDGIQHLDRLETLVLSDSTVQDLGPLAGLSSLRQLFLSGSRVRNIGALASVGQLSKLDLSRTAVSDLAPLAGLPWLTTLKLTDTPVVDLRPLSKSPIQELELGGGPALDLSQLGASARLRTIVIERVTVSNLIALAGIHTLEHVQLEDVNVSREEAVQLARRTRARVVADGREVR